MADAASKDAAAKQRIINHMNADHQDSLVRYLEHWGNLSSYAASNARLEDIAFDSMTISTAKGVNHLITIQPPLSSWSEARPKAVAMDEEARARLKRSDITIKEYVLPNKAWQIAIMTASVLTLLAFSKQSNFLPGSLLFDYFLKYFPRFTVFCYSIQGLVLYPMVMIHAGEAGHMAQSRLEKHSVPQYSLVWWKWVISTFAEGFGAFSRFDEIVAIEKKKRARTKH
ncbi:MAG: hypothetical protein MMC33_000048 [Icmadophila ericetorum]|nr:hypothetical protein [Icmadophila ericetorum]